MPTDLENTRNARWESDLPVSPDVQWREVEYSEDGTGRTTYQHVIYTEWQELPGG